MSYYPKLTVPSIGVKEGLSCVLFRAIVAWKTPNLALPSLQHSVLISYRILLCIWFPWELGVLTLAFTQTLRGLLDSSNERLIAMRPNNMCGGHLLPSLFFLFLFVAERDRVLNQSSFLGPEIGHRHASLPPLSALYVCAPFSPPGVGLFQFCSFH